MKQQLTATALRHSFDRRSVLLGGVQGGVGLLLAARMGYIAVAENERYQMLAESNRVNLSLIPPRRGWILDREGAPLASNRADFRVDIIPERAKDPERTVEQLGKLLELGDVDGLSRALLEYGGDPALRRRHGLAGRARVEQSFTQERVWAALADEYERLAREHGARS